MYPSSTYFYTPASLTGKDVHTHTTKLLWTTTNTFKALISFCLQLGRLDCFWVQDFLGSSDIKNFLARCFCCWFLWPSQIEKSVNPLNRIRAKHFPQPSDPEPCWLCQVFISPASAFHYCLGAPTNCFNWDCTHFNLLNVQCPVTHIHKQRNFTYIFAHEQIMHA